MQWRGRQLATGQHFRITGSSSIVKCFKDELNALLRGARHAPAPCLLVAFAEQARRDDVVP
jgi:hypothetical protein